MKHVEPIQPPTEAELVAIASKSVRFAYIGPTGCKDEDALRDRFITFARELTDRGRSCLVCYGDLEHREDYTDRCMTCDYDDKEVDVEAAIASLTERLDAHGYTAVWDGTAFHIFQDLNANQLRVLEALLLL